jgi:hypothetical protein
MLIEPQPVIDVARQMTQIRDRVARERGTVSGTFSQRIKERWKGVEQQLNEAKPLAALGAEVPPMGRFGGVVRKVARLAAKTILYVLQIITVPQRQFNQALWRALRNTSTMAQQQEAVVQTLLERLDAVQEVCREQSEKIEFLERRVGELDALADSHKPILAKAA